MGRPGPGLDRLLGRAGLEALLASLDAAAPGAHARVVDPAGRIVGDADAHHAGGAVREYPIVAGGEQLGRLVVAAGGAGPAAALMAQALAMAAEQALNVRFLAAETLERYRELNVLYDVGERIAGSLDPTGIVAAALLESRRAVGAGAAVALIDEPGGDRRVIGPGDDQAAVASLAAAGEDLVARVMAGAGADIETGSAAAAAAGFGSLLAVPLRTATAVSGALVLGRGPGRPAFTAGDEKVVAAVAAQVSTALQNAALHERELEARRMEDELAVGRRIQLGLLPLEAPRLEGWDIAAVYRAARQVGGDFYDFVERADGTSLDLIVGDVAGKGVPAALMMAYTRAVLRSESLAGRSPGDLLGHANDTMLGECRRAALLVTAFHGSLDVATGRLRYASAGHDWPLHATAAGAVEFLATNDPMLGLLDRADYAEAEVVLAPGDSLILYTDGITEARSPAAALFGEERLIAAVAAARGGSAGAVVEAITGAVDAFTAGAPPADDLTLVVVRRDD